MSRKKRIGMYLPEELHELIKELTPKGHTQVSTIWDAVNLLKEKRKNGKG